MKKSVFTIYSPIILGLVSILLYFSLQNSPRNHIYYINTQSGSDSNTGKTTSLAWKTIQKAANTMLAGDTCFVTPGNYPERVSISKSGNSSSPIVFKALGSGTVTKGFTIKANYITIDGFEVTQTDKSGGDNSTGIYAVGQSLKILNNYVHITYMEGIYLGSGPSDLSTSNCLVKGNKIVRCGMAGLQVSGQNNIIESNDISGTVQWSVTAPNIASGMDADGMRFFGSGNIIRKNKVHDILLSDSENGNDPHIDCAQSWGPASNIIFEQNDFSLSQNETSGRKQIAMVSYDYSSTLIENLTFRNNVFHDVVRGLNLYGSLASSGLPISGLVIVNNTFAYMYDNPVELHDAPNAVVQNNIFYSTRQVSYDANTSSQNFVIGYNSYYNISNLSSSSNTGDIRNVDPGFISAPNRNFQLQSTSPLIDKGITISSVTNDLNDVTRPKGKGYDIGAYEFDTNAGKPPTTDVKNIEAGKDNSLTPDQFQLAQNFPNPFNPSTVIMFSIPENSFVSLKVYDILGKEVATLINDNMSKGAFQVEFHAQNLPSGMYIYQLRANNNVQTKKMLITK